MNLPAWVAILAALIGAANVAGTTIAVYRGSQNKTRTANQHDLITELQGQVGTMNTMLDAAERAVEWERRERELERKNCEVEIARLTGQVETLQSTVVNTLVDSIKVAVTAALQDVSDRQNRIRRTDPTVEITGNPET